MTESGQNPKTRRRGWVVFWVLTGIAVLMAAGGIIAIHLTGRAFTVPSTSMTNTLQPGDVVIAADTRQVHRGDVIVERQTPATGDYVRRVIGLPGDHVACCDARGRITVNGKPLDEPYVYPGNAPAAARFSVTVPKGRLWLLGDHRSMANDSHVIGPITAQVQGRVVLVLRPGHHPVLLRTPETFIADGLAPASEGTPPVLAAIGVTALGWLLLIALVIIGVVCFVIGRTRRRRRTA